MHGQQQAQDNTEPDEDISSWYSLLPWSSWVVLFLFIAIIFVAAVLKCSEDEEDQKGELLPRHSSTGSSDETSHDSEQSPAVKFSKVQQIFSLLDDDKDGRVSSVDLTKTLTILGMQLNERQTQELIAYVDTKYKGSLKLDELFTCAIKFWSLGESKRDLKFIFSVFDKNGDGFVDVEEFRTALTENGHRLTIEELDKVFNVDGEKMNFEQFVEAMESSPRLRTRVSPRMPPQVLDPHGVSSGSVSGISVLL